MIRLAGLWFFNHDGELEGCYLTFHECLEACLKRKRQVATERVSVRSPRYWETMADVLNPQGYEQRRQRRAV